MTATTAASGPASGPSSPGPAPRWPALDGLRGLAVAAVVAYHLGHLRGGFLGVDLFFVLSGFLITSLLLQERDRTGRISLAGFWERRARRLLPALGVTLVAVVVAGRALLDHDRLPALRVDALTTAAYVANWRFALAPAGGYFAADPSPLRHTWSLAIEEQYYVVWPLVAVAALAVAARRRVAPALLVGGVAAAGIAASGTLMAVKADAWSVDRLYLGTDTRVLAPLVGALLACLLHRRVAARAWATGRAALGAAAVMGLATAALAVATATVSPERTWMYRGGFLAMAVLAAAAVAGGVVAPEGPATRVFAARPLRWLGERSYGLYLYSWPVQAFGAARGVDGLRLSALVVVLSLVLAAASHRWVETPVRFARRRRAAGTEGTGAPEGAAATTGPARFARDPRLLAGGATLVVLATVLAGTVTDAEPDPLATRTQEQFEAEATRPATPPPTPGAEGDIRVLLVGDSVGFTLGQHVPDDLEGIASVEARALPGCGLLIEGGRPPAAVAAGNVPEDYDGCAEPVAEADRIGLEARPDVVLLVTGAWETNPHERDGATVGPGDDAWTDEVRELLDARIERLGSTGATVALWADPCGPDADDRADQRWYLEDVLEPAAEASDAAVVVRPAEVACEGDEPVTDVPGVGDPRPDDGQHWSEDGALWLWQEWLGPALRQARADVRPPEPVPQEGGGEATGDGPTVMVVGDSIGFTLDYHGAPGAAEAGIDLARGVGTIGCGVVREGRSFDGGRDLAESCGGSTAAEEAALAEGDPDIVLAVWGAWEMAGVTGLPAAGTGRFDDPAYDALVRQRLAERLRSLASGGARVVVLGVDCWPAINVNRSAARVAWWQGLSREVAVEVGASYLDPTEALCVDGTAREVPGVGDPRPEDGAHWTPEGATWFWTTWLGPRLQEVAAG